MNQPPTANPAQVYQQYFVPAMFVPWATSRRRRARASVSQRRRRGVSDVRARGDRPRLNVVAGLNRVPIWRSLHGVEPWR